MFFTEKTYYDKCEEFTDKFLMGQIRDNFVIIRHKSKCFNVLLVHAISTNFNGVRILYMITTGVIKS